MGWGGVEYQEPGRVWLPRPAHLVRWLSICRSCRDSNSCFSEGNTRLLNREVDSKKLITPKIPYKYQSEWHNGTIPALWLGASRIESQAPFCNNKTKYFRRAGACQLYTGVGHTRSVVWRMLLADKNGQNTDLPCSNLLFSVIFGFLVKFYIRISTLLPDWMKISHSTFSHTPLPQSCEHPIFWSRISVFCSRISVFCSFGSRIMCDPIF